MELEGIRSFPGFSTPTGAIRFGGYLHRTSGTGFAAYRTHGMFALVLVLGQGAGRYRDKLGKDLRVSAGDLIVVFPDLPHQYGPEGSDIWEEVFISFDGAAFDGWRSLGLEPANPVWRLPAADAWAARFIGILEMPLTSMSQATLAANAIHVLIADALAARAPDPTTIGWLETACRALGGGAGAPSTLEIARNAGLGYENFRKAFKAATGESPGRYRKRMRLAQAALMLKRADLSLEMIAGALDFCDGFHLSKAFKQQYGVSPSEVRRQSFQ